MKVLFTGAASFTGFWFVKTLASHGYDLICPLRGKVANKDVLKQKRLSLIEEVAELVEDAAFGSKRFLSLADSFSFDCICHHASEVRDYRSPAFDVSAALASNTFNLPRVLETFEGTPILLTGSVFEHYEGVNNDSREAVSPYGLSKGLTYDYFRFYCEKVGSQLGKFIIANPFGPFEDKRFTAHLMKSWKAGKVAEVKTPNYIRDNIPVDYLSIRYADYTTQIVSGFNESHSRMSPSGYIGSLRDFVALVANEVSSRTNWKCDYILAKQEDFSEPLTRTNQEKPFDKSGQWQESHFWDAFVDYYQGDDC
jgi:nucleoside-diphosphate-sugar epimerase